MCEMQRQLAYHDSEPTQTTHMDTFAPQKEEPEGTMRIVLLSTSHLFRVHWNATFADLIHGLLSSLPLL